MGGGTRNKRIGTPPPAPVSAEPTIYAATLGASGAVIRIAPIAHTEAVDLRKQGSDIVECGPVLTQNYALARDIEEAAVGAGNWIRHKPHANAGPNALPHCQPNPRPPAGHSFYETPNRHAR